MSSTINLSVVRGTVSAPPEVRALESGSRVAALAVRTNGPDGKDTSVPVTVWEPPAWIETLDATGARGAKTEVEADLVARARDRRRLAAVARRIAAALAALDDVE